MNTSFKGNLNVIDIRKSIVLVCLILLLNTIIVSVIAENQDQNNELVITDSRLSSAVKTEMDILSNFDLNLVNEYLPLGNRGGEPVGLVIGPGNYTGSVDPVSNMFDIYSIYLNGSIANTDYINITVETSTAFTGAASFSSPDRFVIDGWFFDSANPLYMTKHAITSAYHYIAIANPLAGTLDYYLNISTSQTTNAQNDGNSDFGNATAASDGSNIQESLNATWDYWDEFSLTIPTDKNLIVTCEIESSHYFDVVLELYDAPNSSGEHLLAEVDEGGFDDDEVLYYNSNITQINGYLHVSLWNVYGISAHGSYWLNFSIREPNLKPKINLSDPNINLWNTASGLVMNEDQISDGDIVLSEHFMDDGMPATPGLLTYSHSTDNDNISVVIHANSSVTITPTSNWFGSAVVTFFANDTVFEASSDLNITVNSVNDMPVLELADNWLEGENNTAVSFDGENINVDQGGLVNLTAIATDIDSPTLTFSVDSFNLTGIVATEDPFTITSEGTIDFTPDNDHTGSFEFKLKVTDGEDDVTNNFTFIISNVNDPPSITKIWVGTNSVNVVDNSAGLSGVMAATEDEEFNFTVQGMDIDLGDTLTFTKETGPFTLVANIFDDMRTNFSFTPTNSDALMGYVHINISVSDESLPDDYVMINITVNGVNDPPLFTAIGSMPATVLRYRDMGDIYVNEYSNFTISASDIDEDTLTLTADNSDVTIKELEYGLWEISFHPLVEENVTVNFTLNDGEVTDYYNLFWVVETKEPPKPPNREPVLGITTAAGTKFNIGDDVVIEGTWSDPDEDDVLIEIIITFPDGNTFPIDILGFISFIEPPDSPAEDEFHYLEIIDDGTWKYTFQSGEYKKFYEEAEKIGFQSLFGPEMKKGEYTFKFRASDDTLFGGWFGLTSENVSVTIELSEKKGDDGDGDGDDEPTMSMGMFDYDILIILIVIIVIVLVLVMVLMKKKKPREEAPPPTGMMPPAELNCPACGAMVPAGSELCPACGAAAPPPPPPTEQPPEQPPVDITCTSCGATIPAGYQACPACGAALPPPPPPPPAEQPPEQPQYQYEQPPAEYPPDQPQYVEQPPEQPPAEYPPEQPQYGDMPPEQPHEQPPAEYPPEQPQYGDMPPEQPPEQPPAEYPPEQQPYQENQEYQEYQEMPPEQPPAQYPPPQQPPQQQPPPAQTGMVACPTCGGQLVVGQTPCPSCGAQLTW
jgi:hypothetical protein